MGRIHSVEITAAWALVALVCLAAYGAHAATGATVVVTADELVEKPVSPLIYGNFIESGIGRQVEGMWAEMLFNRSFEDVPPYTDYTWMSQGRGGPEGVEKAVWWHSGYEENDWFLVPGNAAAGWGCTRYFEFFKGCQAGRLTNESREQWAAVAQNGIYLKEGETYTFRGMMRGWRDEGTESHDLPEIRLYPEGDWSKPILTHALDGLADEFRECTWTFKVEDFEGRAAFSVWIPPRSGVGLDDFSLMPASNVGGWRADVVEAARRVNPKVLRWPGGCFASFYHWREGIGPRRDRLSTESWYWGGLHENDVGTPEFIGFCRLVGAEPLICINMMTGTPQEAAEWVAYCNAPASHPIGALRVRDGSEKPFGVTLWELDNETFRKWSPRQYAEACIEFSRAMKAVDPTIRLALVAYDAFGGSLLEMLEICGEHVDLVVDRDISETGLRRDLRIIGDYNAKHGTSIELCNTEWIGPFKELPREVEAQLAPDERGACSRRMRWECALTAAETLLTFQRLGADFAFADYNNFANTWGHNVIECPKEGVYLSTVGRVFELFSRSPAAWPLKIEASGLPDGVQVQAAWDLKRRALCLVVVSRRSDEVRVAFDLAALGRRFTSAQTAVLSAPSLLSYNTLDQPETIKRTDSTSTPADPARLEIAAQRYSVTHVVLR